MTAGVTLPLRKVHARAFCDEGSVCVKGKNNFEPGEALDGERETKPARACYLFTKLHSDELEGNFRNATLESPTSEKPKFW